MTQLQYNIIVKCIRTGCAALADELIPAFDNVVTDAAKWQNEQAELAKTDDKTKEVSKKKEAN